MAKPIVIPATPSVDDQFRAAMRDPRVRKAIKKNPLMADRFRAMLMARQEQPGRPVGPGGPGRQAYRRPAVGSTFAAAPVMVEGDTSLAAVVRAKRDSFLVDDGVQVSGDYTDAIRAQTGGGISPQSMPPVGYSAANYSYPSAAMRTGAALGRMVRPRAEQFTQTRKPLPTASFWPGAFVTSRPDSVNRTLITNKPVPMPRETVRGTRSEMMRTGLVQSSPSDDRRRVMTTLMGLGDVPSAKDPHSGVLTTDYYLLADFLENDADYNKNYPNFAKSLATIFGLVGYLPTTSDKMTPEEKKRWGFDGPVDFSVAGVERGVRIAAWALLVALKAVFEQVILTLILADKFDLNSPLVKLILDATPLKDKANGDYNKLVNDTLSKFYGEKYGPMIMALGGQMPFDLNATGVRRYFIAYLYRRIWGAEITPAIYNGLSSKLVCDSALGSRVSVAISEMMLPEYAPGKKPKVYTCPAAGAVVVPDTGAGAGTGGGDGEVAETPANMKWVKAGIFGGLALLAVGIYAKVR